MTRVISLCLYGDIQYVWILDTSSWYEQFLDIGIGILKSLCQYRYQKRQQRLCNQKFYAFAAILPDDNDASMTGGDDDVYMPFMNNNFYECLLPAGDV